MTENVYEMKLGAMTSRTVITVDGLAGVGKTAISKELASMLGFVHFSTGMLYRAVGYLALMHKVDPENGNALRQVLCEHEISLALDQKNSARVYIDAQDVSSKLYKPEVSEATSQAAQHKEVRNTLTQPQREAFPGNNLVAEGRDMGTVIFPDAQVKFFLNVQEEVKVARRLKQLQDDMQLNGKHELNSLKEKMKIEVRERDERDTHRVLAPTHPAPDAILIDNSELPLTQVVKNMYDAAVSVIQRK